MKLTLDTFIGDYLEGNVHLSKGDIGIEIEVEGFNLPRNLGPNNHWWATHEDHSLRGEAIEYVLSAPMKKADCIKALAFLNEALTAPNVRVDRRSPRTSVHVHRNRQGWRVQEIYTHAALYFIVEPLLARFAGDNRVGNMYCLSACDAEYLPILLAQSIAEKKYLGAMQRGDDIRYSGLNMASLFKFGSVEYRLLHGTIDNNEIEQWLGVIDDLEVWGQKLPNPRAVYDLFSGSARDEFLYTIFSDRAFIKFCLGIPNYGDLMFEGSLYTLEIANAMREWPVLESKNEARAKRKVEQAIQNDPVRRHRWWRDNFGFSEEEANAIQHNENMHDIRFDYPDNAEHVLMVDQVVDGVRLQARRNLEARQRALDMVARVAQVNAPVNPVNWGVLGEAVPRRRPEPIIPPIFNPMEEEGQI